MTSAAHQPNVKHPPNTDRRAYAYWVGEQHARSRRITSDAFLFLYKELVRLAGDRAYCWPGQEFLVESLDTSIGTLKRWFRELEQAKLIRRVPRAGGQTSLTYITAFEETDTTEPDPEPDADLPPAPLFFVPAQEITSDPDAGSQMIHHTVKTQESKLREHGGGVQTGNEPPALADEQEQLLEREGIIDPPTLAALRTLPLEELEAVSAYLNRQTNVRSRASLFAWLARNRFGRSLLDGRRADATPRTAPARPGIAQPPTSGDDAPRALWDAVLNAVRDDIDADLFHTWLVPTTPLLIDADEGVLVVGTPNVFVRDEIASTYLERLEHAVAQAAGTSLRLQLVIGN